MKKYVSDIDETPDGKFAVEWEFEDGGRYWEEFDTVIERDDVICENSRDNDESVNDLESENYFNY